MKQKGVGICKKEVNGAICRTGGLKQENSATIVGFKRERMAVGSPLKSRKCKRQTPNSKKALKQETASPSSQPSVCAVNPVMADSEDAMHGHYKKKIGDGRVVGSQRRLSADSTKNYEIP